MADKKLTIADVKKMKVDLEAEILKMIKAFEKDTGVKVTYLNVKRDYPDEKYPDVVETKNYPIKDIELNVDLDLVY